MSEDGGGGNGHSKKLDSGNSRVKRLWEESVHARLAAVEQEVIVMAAQIEEICTSIRELREYIQESLLEP